MVTKTKPSLCSKAHYANKKFHNTNSSMRLRKEPSGPSLPLGETSGLSRKHCFTKTNTKIAQQLQAGNKQ